MTKAIEKEIGKIKYAKLLSNRAVLISAVKQKQQERILKLGSLDGRKIMVHIPGMAAVERSDFKCTTGNVHRRGEERHTM